MAFEQFPGLPNKVKTGLPVYHKNFVMTIWKLRHDNLEMGRKTQPGKTYPCR